MNDPARINVTSKTQADTTGKDTTASPVVCVDLDGTLIKTDILWESILLLIQQQPWLLCIAPLWLIKGRAYFKSKLAEHIIVDPASLPYREDILSYLQQKVSSGHKIVLATASDQQPAEAIATHLGIFSEVLSSNGVMNLSGRQKREKLIERFGKQGFDYIGDSATDLPVWQAAKTALLVEPSQRVLAQAQASCIISKVFHRNAHPIQNIVRALRLGQWVKNVLIFLPLLAAHQFYTWEQPIRSLWAFAAFCLCASSIYVVNDLLDLSADRRHPKKKHRPFANGSLSIRYGLILSPTLFLGSVLLSLATLPSSFLSLLGLYAATTAGYSLYFKQVAILDVLTLAGLYTVRVLAGGFAIGIPISAWLLAFSMFLFLSLAFTKRHLELEFRKVGETQGLERRAYQGLDKQVLATMGIISGYMSVLVLALYINSQDVLALYRYPKALWLVCPLLLYWISRNWLLAHRGALDDDPLLLAIKDPHSYFVAAAASLVTILAM